MTPHQIVEKLKADGVELAVDCGCIKLRPASKVTNECKALIANNKPALLSYLATGSNEQNCGSPTCNEKVDTNEDLGAQIALFKSLWIIKQRSKGIGTDDSFTKRQKSNKIEVV